MLINRTNHHVAGTKRLIMLNTSPRHLAIEARRQRRQITLTTYVRTWPIKPVRQDRSMDPEDVPRHEMTATKPGAININKFEGSTEHRCHPNSVVTLPGIDAPHTPCALQMR